MIPGSFTFGCLVSAEQGDLNDMNLQERQNYRPQVHFTPLSMWINDPNGMVYADGMYHLFYQHNTKEARWGNIHWGHGISADLLHWQHLPVALCPDELGLIFSGSCVFDTLNTSGFGTADRPPMVAVYTNHDPETGKEVQSIAYSTDYLNFIKYTNNPVLENSNSKDFRDPKVFWNPVRNAWSLVLAAGDRVNFYTSRNLKEWEQTGEFITGENGLKGICECPDCFPVQTGEGTKWVLIISMIIGDDTKGNAGHKTQYFVGEFDGNRFTDTEKAEEPLWLNYGTDYYAAVTFQNTEDNILLGWADNWAYANETPTGSYRGQMSLAAKIDLKKTSAGYRIALSPIGLEKLKADSRSLGKESRLEGESFGLTVTGKGNGKISIHNDLGEKLTIEVTPDEIIIDRTNADKKDFSEKYAMFNKISAKRYQKGDYRLEMVFDVSLLELFAEEGLIPAAVSVYPAEPYNHLLLEGDMEAAIYPVK